MPDVLTASALRVRPASPDDALSVVSSKLPQPAGLLAGNEPAVPTPSAGTLRALAAAHLALLEADWRQCSLRGPRTTRLRQVWVRTHARVLRTGMARDAREQALRALVLWERTLVSRPDAASEARAQWCALYALAGCTQAQRMRLAPALALELLRIRAPLARP